MAESMALRHVKGKGNTRMMNMTTSETRSKKVSWLWGNGKSISKVSSRAEDGTRAQGVDVLVKLSWKERTCEYSA